MRLIDADELKKYPIRKDNYDKEHGDLNFVLGIESVLEYADFVPTIAAEPVKHGHWYDKGSLSCRCSECGGKSPNESKFCGNCGAKMDGGADNETD